MWRFQKLTDQIRNQGMEFCRWFMEKDIDQKLIIFSDEKWFFMNSAPNRQNFRHWAVSNPYSFEECHNQGQKKIMCWAGIIDGTVL